MLEFLLMSVIEQIKAANTADITHPEHLVKEMRRQTKLTVKLIIDKLHRRIVDQENISSDLLNLSNSLNTESISKIKKIFIFLRENEHNNDGIDLHHTIQLLKQIITKTFRLVPKAIQIRDFFSLIREIFFYNKQMDEVDYKLAEDMLTTFNDIIRPRRNLPSSGSSP